MLAEEIMKVLAQCRARDTLFHSVDEARDATTFIDKALCLDVERQHSGEIALAYLDVVRHATQKLFGAYDLNFATECLDKTTTLNVLPSQITNEIVRWYVEVAQLRSKDQASSERIQDCLDKAARLDTEKAFTASIYAAYLNLARSVKRNGGVGAELKKCLDNLCALDKIADSDVEQIAGEYFNVAQYFVISPLQPNLNMAIDCLNRASDLSKVPKTLDSICLLYSKVAQRLMTQDNPNMASAHSCLDKALKFSQTDTSKHTVVTSYVTLHNLLTEKGDTADAMLAADKAFGAVQVVVHDNTLLLNLYQQLQMKAYLTFSIEHNKSSADIEKHLNIIEQQDKQLFVSIGTAWAKRIAQTKPTKSLALISKIEHCEISEEQKCQLSKLKDEAHYAKARSEFGRKKYETALQTLSQISAASKDIATLRLDSMTALVQHNCDNQNFDKAIEYIFAVYNIDPSRDLGALRIQVALGVVNAQPTKVLELLECVMCTDALKIKSTAYIALATNASTTQEEIDYLSKAQQCVPADLAIMRKRFDKYLAYAQKSRNEARSALADAESVVDIMAKYSEEDAQMCLHKLYMTYMNSANKDKALSVAQKITTYQWLYLALAQKSSDQLLNVYDTLLDLYSERAEDLRSLVHQDIKDAWEVIHCEDATQLLVCSPQSAAHEATQRKKALRAKEVDENVAVHQAAASEYMSWTVKGATYSYTPGTSYGSYTAYQIMPRVFGAIEHTLSTGDGGVDARFCKALQIGVAARTEGENGVKITGNGYEIKVTSLDVRLTATTVYKCHVRPYAQDVQSSAAPTSCAGPAKAHAPKVGKKPPQKLPQKEAQNDITFVFFNKIANHAQGPELGPDVVQMMGDGNDGWIEVT